MVAYIIIGIIAYLIGSISFSVIISKKMAGFDVRTKGSGNAGSTNVLRSVGKKAALITLVCDILKGIVAIGIAVIVGAIIKSESINDAILVQVASVAVIIGHTYPVFFGFKGGKGVATSLGVILFLNWKVGLICLVFAISLMAIARMVSLGSISAAVLFPILALPMQDSFIVEGNYFVFALIMAAIVIFNHRSNIKRIMAGTENKLSFKKKEEKPEEKKAESKDAKTETKVEAKKEEKKENKKVEKEDKKAEAKTEEKTEAKAEEKVEEKTEDNKEEVKEETK